MEKYHYRAARDIATEVRLLIAHLDGRSLNAAERSFLTTLRRSSSMLENAVRDMERAGRQP